MLWEAPDFWYRGTGIDDVEDMVVHVFSGGGPDPRGRPGRLVGSAQVSVIDLWGREGLVKEAWYDLKRGEQVAGQVRLCVQVGPCLHVSKRCDDGAGGRLWRAGRHGALPLVRGPLRSRSRALARLLHAGVPLAFPVFPPSSPPYPTFLPYLATYPAPPPSLCFLRVPSPHLSPGLSFVSPPPPSPTSQVVGAGAAKAARRYFARILLLDQLRVTGLQQTPSRPLPPDAVLVLSCGSFTTRSSMVVETFSPSWPDTLRCDSDDLATSDLVTLSLVDVDGVSDTVLATCTIPVFDLFGPPSGRVREAQYPMFNAEARVCLLGVRLTLQGPRAGEGRAGPPRLTLSHLSAIGLKCAPDGKPGAAMLRVTFAGQTFRTTVARKSTDPKYGPEEVFAWFPAATTTATNAAALAAKRRQAMIDDAAARPVTPSSPKVGAGPGTPRAGPGAVGTPQMPSTSRLGPGSGTPRAGPATARKGSVLGGAAPLLSPSGSTSGRGPLGTPRGTTARKPSVFGLGPSALGLGLGSGLVVATGADWDGGSVDSGTTAVVPMGGVPAALGGVAPGTPWPADILMMGKDGQPSASAAAGSGGGGVNDVTIQVFLCDRLKDTAAGVAVIPSKVLVQSNGVPMAAVFPIRDSGTGRLFATFTWQGAGGVAMEADRLPDYVGAMESGMRSGKGSLAWKDGRRCVRVCVCVCGAGGVVGGRGPCASHIGSGAHPLPCCA